VLKLPTFLRLTLHALAIAISYLPGFAKSSNQGKTFMQIGSQFPISKLSGKSGPLTLDSSRYTVLYFYPKDKTPGCTIEAGEFQKSKPTFDAQKIRIVGISVDDFKSHESFCEAMSLSFELATDENGKLGEELGILAGGLHKRVTYVINQAGMVVLHYATVKPSDHAGQILTDISNL